MRPPSHPCPTGRASSSRPPFHLLPPASPPAPTPRARRRRPIRPAALFGWGSNAPPKTPQQTNNQKSWLSLFSDRLGGGAAAAAAPSPPPPPAAAPVDDAPFLEFLARELGAAPQPTVLAKTAWGGRGLVAARPIARGELAAFVPESAAVTAEAAAGESPLLRAAGARDSPRPLTANLPDWTALAVWLVEQRHAVEQQQQDQRGRWAPYVARLPATTGTVLEWFPLGARVVRGGGGNSQQEQQQQERRERREELVARELAGSGLRHKAAEILRAADATWREVEALASVSPSARGGAGGPYTRARLEWALGVLLSRVVRLDGAPGQPSALVPWCDYLNHAPGAHCYLDLVFLPPSSSSSSAAAVVVGVRADRAYRPGEEVFISYGPKSSGELLLSYGFCPPLDSNAANDRAFMQVGVPDSSPAKRRALARRGIPPEETFALRADALPEGLLPYVAFADAELGAQGAGGEEEGEDAAAEALAAALFGGAFGDDDDDGEGGGGDAAAAAATATGLPSAELEQVAWRGVAARCRAALADYTTDERRDRELAASAPLVRERGASAADPAERAAALAEVRLRERRILGAAMFAATGQAKKLSGGARARRVF